RFTYNNHSSTGYRENGFFQRWNFSFRVDHKFDDGSRFRTYVGSSYEKRGEFIEWASQNLPTNLFYSWRDQDRRTRFTTVDAYVMYDKPISPRFATMFRASFISSLFADQYQREGDYYPAQGTGAEVHFDWLPHPAHSLTFGVEYKTDGGHTKYIGKRRGYSLAPFIQDEWRVFKTLTITPGVRYDSYQIVGEEFKEEHVNPKFGVNFSPLKGTTFRFSAGSAFRAASVTERYISAKLGDLPPIIPNEDLKAETSLSYDFGIFQQLTTDWYVDGAIFQNEYNNFIDIVEEMDHHFNVFAQFRNITEARIRGIELSTKASFWRNRIGIQANCTWMDAINLTKNQVMDYRPKFIGVITPSLKFGPAEFQMDYRYTSKFETVKLYDYDVRAPQKVANLRLSYKLGKLSLMLSMNNAFNYQYIQLERFLGEIRHVSASMMWEW
ncbi:TonB-dependent receptor, partial [candidate division KSB1 bacterium]|nr:TonB-dependent receptor [candidate division KSB1 bacterium]